MAPLSNLLARIGKPLQPALLLAVGALLGLGACVGGLPPLSPGSDIGVVEGRVREASAGVAAQVEFVDNEGPLYAELKVVADSTGWYRAELPIGLYHVRLVLDGTTAGSYTNNDTILVGRCTRRYDFERTRATVSVLLPPELDGEVARLTTVGSNCRAGASQRVADGRVDFDLRLLPPARYTMRMSVGYDMAEFYLPTTYVSGDADSLDARHGTGAYAIDLSDRMASVSGRVTGAWQDLGVSMNVDAVTLLGRHISGSWCADDGSYRLTTFVPEPVRIVTRCQGIENWYGGARRATATVLDLRPGQAVTDIDIHDGAINVRFTGPGDRVPERHTLFVRRADGSEVQVDYTWGNPLAVPNLPPGDYRLRVGGYCDRDAWQPQWYGGGADSTTAVPVTVVAGEVATVTMTLQGGGSLAGVFEGEDSDTWHSHAVAIRDGNGAALCASPVTTYYGGFSFAGLADGEYLLSLGSSGGLYWYPGTFDQSAATRLVISGGNAITGLVWHGVAKADRRLP